MTGDTITAAWPATSKGGLAKVIHVAGERIVAKNQSKHVARFRFVIVILIVSAASAAVRRPLLLTRLSGLAWRRLRLNVDFLRAATSRRPRASQRGRDQDDSTGRSLHG